MESRSVCDELDNCLWATGTGLLYDPALRCSRTGWTWRLKSHGSWARGDGIAGAPFTKADCTYNITIILESSP